MLKDINKMFITVIPKSDNLESRNHFRPISLCNICNICYKIIATILTNRIKHLLSKIVSPLQGAFAQGHGQKFRFFRPIFRRNIIFR